MATSFTLKRLTEESPFDTSDLDKRLAEIQGRITKLQEPKKLQQVAQPFEVKSMLPTALGILSAAAAQRQQNYSGSGVDGPGTKGLTFGQANPKYMSLGSSVLGAVQSIFPGVTSGGQFVARNIAGTNTPSEHAYGAAVDLMIPGSNKALGDKVYSWLLQNQGNYGYSSIIWQQPGHYNHIHVGWLY